jgi:hypothetical protein
MYTPTVRKADVANLSRDDVIRRLFSSWLEYHRSTDAGPLYRLTEYDVLGVEAIGDPKAAPGGSDSFGGMVRYSVKPANRSSHWRAGNGIIEGDWIRGKFLFVRIDGDGDSYSLGSMGTGP